MSTSINKNELRFYPVQCLDETFQTLAAQEGHVYFVTDKKKIYLGKDGKKIPMCSSSGIFYGNKNPEYDDSGNAPDPKMTFLFEEIEGDDIPEVDDLILNIGVEEATDGCFYRVNAINEDSVETTRLTLQGTGVGGGGSGGGSGTAGGFSVMISGGNKSLKVFSSAATEMPISFTCNYDTSSGVANGISRVTFTTSGSNEPFYTYSPANESDMAFNTMHTIDLVDYRQYFENSKTTISVRVYDWFENSRAADVYLQIVSLELLEPTTRLLDATDTHYSLSVILNAPTDSSSISDRKITYTFYKESNLNSVVTTLEKTLTNSDVGTVQHILDLSALTIGTVYQVQVQASAKINGTVNRITSNIITFKLGYRNATEPQLMIYTPDKTEQYTDIPIYYYVAGVKDGENYTLQIKLNGIEKISLTVQSNKAGVYYLYFEDTNTYTLNCNVTELNLSYSAYLNISPYSGTLPIIDPTRSDLMLYMSPRGKTNNAVDRNIWADYNNTSIYGELTNITYGATSGWLTDDENVSYLGLTSGAKFSINNFRPFEVDYSKRDGFTIELDFQVNGTLDYSQPLFSCLSQNRSDITVGFVVTGEKVHFYNGRKNGSINDKGEPIGSLANISIVEGKRIRLSIVVEPNTIDYPMCYMYLNGKLSAAVIYDKNDTYNDDSFEPGYFKADSRYGQVKIYGIRYYKNALNSQTILNNYTASLSTNEERQERYATNNVLVNSQIHYNTVVSEDYDLQIPVMTITGGYATKDKWTIDTTSDSEAKLPTGKKDYRMIDVSVKYPKNALFNGYEDYSYVNKFADGKTMATANGMTPLNGGCIMYAQGTSSMEYPVKNLRLRWKDKNDYFTVKQGLDPVSIICMKADYMDSSGSHNTGSGNLIDDAYLQDVMTPGQKHFGKDKTVTCIKGYPCLIFWSKTGEAGSYEFIGKYNLNLDKATPEPFGFQHDDSDFGYLPVGYTYYEDDVQKTVQEGEKVNSIHCYEFLDNAIEVCNFLVKANSSNYHDTWYDTFVNSDNEKVPGWTLGFESRYPEDMVGYHDADPLYPLASWINELYILRQSNAEKALKRFKNEYQCYLDRDFLFTYYLITEALLMVDSRVKNMMIATWGPKEVSYIDENGAAKKSNNYIFYPIFYDMDTILGLDNTGAARFTYYNEDTEQNIYNGAGILWNFVRDALGDELAAYFSNLEKGKLTAKDILAYYNENQANLANEAFYNADAVVKYTDPARNGYQDLLNDKYVAPGAAPYLYAAQGDRSLMRESFVNDRMRFLRGKHCSNSFQSGDRVEFRINWKSGEGIAVPSKNTIELTSLRIGYAGMKVGANGEPKVQRFKAGETIKMLVPAFNEQANGTEGYILGLSNLTDLGDLSDKYCQNFIIASSDCRLTTLTLGNSHKDYDNPFFGTNGIDAKIDVSSCPYLQKFNLQNCSSFKNTLNFSKCYDIQTILLTGSSTTGVTFPVNGALKEVRLPTTVTSIRIDSHANLKKENFSIGTYDYLAAGSNTITDNQYYVNDYSKVRSVYIADTDIDSYGIVHDSQVLTSFYLKNVNWKVSYGISSEDYQYIQLPVQQMQDGKTYYVWNGSSYTPYNKVVDANVSTVFEKVNAIQGESLVAIPVLDKLATLKSVEDSVSVSDSLTGKLTITLDDNVKVDELAIYNKYHAKFPDLSIVYSGGTISKAYRIKFYRTRYISGMTESQLGEPYFVALTTGDSSLADLINDVGYKDPAIADENEYTYTFVKQWINLANNKNTYYSMDDDPDSNSRYPRFSEVKPVEDMCLVPIFSQQTRQYHINFYDYDYNAETSTPLFTLKATYAQSLQKLTDKEPRTKFIYREDSQLLERERWTLKYWISEADFNNNLASPAKINFNNIIVYNDLNYFPYYVKEEIDKPTIEEAFEAIQVSPITCTSPEGHPQLVFNALWGIQVKEEYKNILGGKITLPKSINGRELDTIANLKGLSDKVTDIYVESNSSYQYVGAGCFESSPVKNVHLPDSIIAIGESAFYQSQVVQCSERLGELPNSLQYIDVNGFYNARNFTLTKLPTSLVIMDDRAFASIKASIMTIPESVIKIGTQAFLGTTGLSVSALPDKPDDGKSYLCGHSAFAASSEVTSFAIGKNWTIQATPTNSLFGNNYTKLTSVSVYQNSFEDAIVTQDIVWEYLFNKNRENMTYSVMQS